MGTRKPFLLRVEPGVLAALERWAADDLRSVNGQIEYLLREALRRAGRKVGAPPETGEAPGEDAAAAAAADDEPPVRAARKRGP